MNSTASRFNEGGRPLFARDADRHLFPAPTQYKPDRFVKYDNSTKYNPRKPSLNNEIRFKQSQEEKDDNPGPGQYREVKANQKSKPAFAQERSDRKLLNKDKSSAPGPSSYDIVSGLSMCSSTQFMGPLPQSPIPQINSQEAIKTAYDF